VVASAELLLRPDFHAERVDQRQRPQIGLRCALKQKLVPKQLCGFRRRPVLAHLAVGQCLIAVTLCQRRRRERDCDNEAGAWPNGCEALHRVLPLTSFSSTARWARPSSP